jgi:hypothetical protein
MIIASASACTSLSSSNRANGPAVPAPSTPDSVPAASTVAAAATGIDSRTGMYGNYHLGIVKIEEGIVSGDGCYDDRGNMIVLIDNDNAVDPTYSQLVQFLQADTIDEYPYISTGNSPGTILGSAESRVDLPQIQKIIDGTALPVPPDVCADFAERLYNDAELAGIKCAFVTIDTSTGFHALNAFQTADDGLVFIDDTGIVSNAVRSSTGTPRCVKTVNVKVGTDYIPVSLFPYPGWSSAWCSMGTVISCQITWGGNWNN